MKVTHLKHLKLSKVGLTSKGLDAWKMETVAEDPVLTSWGTNLSVADRDPTALMGESRGANPGASRHSAVRNLSEKLPNHTQEWKQAA